jgi:phosphate acetyltransferase
MVQPHSRSQLLIARARALGPVPTAVVYPCSRDALAGAMQAHAAGLITPILIGPRARIADIAAAEQIDLGACEIEDVAEPAAAAQRAAAMVDEGRVEALMKGSLHTDELMSVIVSRAAGLRTARRLSHVFVMDVPGHEKLLLITDAAVNIAPDLKVKADIVRNAIDVAHAIGIAEPRIALLSAVETVNPGIPSTVDAAALREMAQRGEISGGILDGPLAFDNAISAEAAHIKGISSPVSGKVDILVVPALEAGNILYKSLVYLGGAVAAGVVLGARVPVILTSRADSPESRTASAAVACLIAHERRHETIEK